MREVSRVSSLILRAKLLMAKKVLRHGNRFPARVRRLLFFGGREATSGIASAVRRLLSRQSKGKTDLEDYKKPRFHNT